MLPAPPNEEMFGMRKATADKLEQSSPVTSDWFGKQGWNNGVKKGTTVAEEILNAILIPVLILSAANVMVSWLSW